MMVSLILRRSSSSLAPRRALAAFTSIQNLVHFQSTASAAAAGEPRHGGSLSSEFRSFSVLAAFRSSLGSSDVVDNVNINRNGRDFHSKPGPLDFKASLVSQAEFAMDDYGYDEEKGSSSGNENVSEEGLEIAKLGISLEITSALASKGISKLFPIQKAVLEPAMKGRDLFGRARTGTGKTLAFGIPILDKIIRFNEKHGKGRSPLALVLAPTRELARQVDKEFKEAAPSMDTICAYGGTPIGSQIRTLEYGVDIVVGTPGRIIDLMKRGCLDLSQIQFVILDEADQMLSVGFVDDIETIFQRLPQKRHSMLFSATMPSWIRSLVRNYLKDPLTIDLVGDSDKKLADGITLYSIATRNMHGKASILGPLITEHAKGGKCIVFTQTKRDADRLAYNMAQKFRCEALHGDITQSQRERTLSDFRNGRFNVLVATDVAARGLDVPNVDLIIHYEMPNSSETFVHRSGRTGRAGKKGTAILVHTEDQIRQVKIIERDVGCKFTELPRITVEGGDGGMLDNMGGSNRFGSYGGARNRQFDDRGYGRSSGFGRQGNQGSSRFGSQDGQSSGRFGNNQNRPGNYSSPGYGGTGGSDRSSAFWDFGSGRPSGFGENQSNRPVGASSDSRSSQFGNFGQSRKGY